MFGLMRNLYLHLQKKSAPRSFTIVFLGLDGSGKTTCVAALKGEPTEEATQTWGFSSEKVEVAQSSVEVYDLGGAKSIRRIWENYYAEVHGIVFVVDASDESRLPEAKAAFEEAVSHAYARVSAGAICLSSPPPDAYVADAPRLRLRLSLGEAPPGLLEQAGPGQSVLNDGERPPGLPGPGQS